MQDAQMLKYLHMFRETGSSEDVQTKKWSSFSSRQFLLSSLAFDNIIIVLHMWITWQSFKLSDSLLVWKNKRQKRRDKTIQSNREITQDKVKGHAGFHAGFLSWPTCICSRFSSLQRFNSNQKAGGCLKEIWLHRVHKGNTDFYMLGWEVKQSFHTLVLYQPCSTCTPHERGLKHYSTAPPGGCIYDAQPGLVRKCCNIMQPPAKSTITSWGCVFVWLYEDIKTQIWSTFLKKSHQYNKNLEFGVIRLTVLLFKVSLSPHYGLNVLNFMACFLNKCI